MVKLAPQGVAERVKSRVPRHEDALAWNSLSQKVLARRRRRREMQTRKRRDHPSVRLLGIGQVGVGTQSRLNVENGHAAVKRRECRGGGTQRVALHNGGMRHLTPERLATRGKHTRKKRR